MADRFSSSRRISSTFLTGALAAAALCLMAPSLAAQELEQQVALSVQLLELSVSEWQARAALPASDDADTRSIALAAVEKKFKTERAELFQKYGTTATAHLTFFASHAADVDRYFESNPEIKARVETLSRTLRTLIEQLESKVGVPEGVPQ